MAKTVNIHDMDWVQSPGSGAFGVKRKHLTAHTDACNLGCSFYELAPGKKPCPAHFHYGNDEAVFVMRGELTLILDGVEHTLTAGSYVTLPAGTGVAHQLHNKSDTPVQYLCISTMQPTDVVIYPNSGKIGVFGGMAPGGQEGAGTICRFVKGAAIDYWDGEDE